MRACVRAREGVRACVRGLQYFAGNRCEVAASTPPSSPRATKTEAKADKDAKELAEYRRVKKMLGVLPSEDGSVVLKPLESIAPLVLRELSEHDKDYLTQSPPVLRATPTVPRKKGGKGEAPAFKHAAAAQMNIECCRSAQLVAMLGVPIGIRTITEKREVCSDFIPEITPSVVCGWYDGRSGGSA